MRNVNVITRPRTGSKGRTVTGHLHAATEHPDISERFILANDDMMILEPIPEIPILNRGYIIDVLAQLRPGHGTRKPWIATLYTLTELTRKGYNNPLSFELHIPFPVTKSLLRRVLEDGEGKPGRDRRTVYGAYAGYKGDTIPDVKLYRATDPIPEGPFLSTSDSSFRFLRRHTQRHLPNKSPYER